VLFRSRDDGSTACGGVAEQWATRPAVKARAAVVAPAGRVRRPARMPQATLIARPAVVPAGAREVELLEALGAHVADRRAIPAEEGEPEGVPVTLGVQLRADPAQVPDFVALRGDSSDRIPGAKGVGPERAAAVLRKHETLDAALESGGFPDQVDDLRKYARITRLQYHAPMPDLPDAEPDWPAAADVAERWGLKNLAKRLRERAGA
jgi:hypothetical protein